MNRNEWKAADGANRRARNLECYKDVGAEYIAPTKGRDTGRRQSQEARLAGLRHWGMRKLREPDDLPPTPAVIAVMASLGKKPYVETRATRLADYRQQVHMTLANSGLASLWMRERALGLVHTVERGVAALRAAA